MSRKTPDIAKQLKYVLVQLIYTELRDAQNFEGLTLDQRCVKIDELRKKAQVIADEIDAFAQQEIKRHKELRAINKNLSS